jgi:two-component system OmpR family sensor kinase
VRRGRYGFHPPGLQHDRWAGRRLRFRLRGQLFWWAGATILVTGLVTLGVVHLVAPSSPFRSDLAESARGFVAGRFAEVWDRPAERRALARELSQTFRVGVRLEDREHRVLDHTGDACRWGSPTPVRKNGETLGRVMLCFSASRRFGGWLFLVGLFAASLTLWSASAWFARRLSRPFIDLVRVAREIGEGRLSSRMRLGRHHVGEAAILAEAINDMASRIERQIEDHRELLAAVSHELRSPLTRLRVLVELADQQGDSAENRRKIEREVLEIDALVGKLLANSRLDFEVLELQQLDAADVAARALERAGLAPELLDDRAPGLRFAGDATLLARGLGNLLENAIRHGGGLEALLVTADATRVRFEALDRGPGFAEATRIRAFEPFFRGSARKEGAAPTHDGGALGLGLSLVARIARAHGGKAFAENREPRGARVVLEVPLEAPGPRGRTGTH